MITAAESEQIIVENQTKKVSTHSCETCGYACGFLIHHFTPPDIWFDGGCDCTKSPRSHRPATYAEIATHYNDLTTDEARQAFMNRMEGTP